MYPLKMNDSVCGVFREKKRILDDNVNHLNMLYNLIAYA